MPVIDPRFKWQAQGPRKSEGTVDKTKCGRGPWPIATVRAYRNQWRATLHWYSTPADSFPAPKLPAAVVVDVRDTARTVAQDALTELAPALHDYHVWLALRRAAQREAHEKEEEERAARRERRAELGKLITTAHPELRLAGSGLAAPWVGVDIETLAKALGVASASTGRLFNAYLDWMHSDPGGAGLSEVITSWPGYSEWLSARDTRKEI